MRRKMTEQRATARVIVRYKVCLSIIEGYKHHRRDFVCSSHLLCSSTATTEELLSLRRAGADSVGCNTVGVEFASSLQLHLLFPPWILLQ